MTSEKNNAVLRMSDFVGKGYEEFWNFKGRYRVVKGSRASKKSKTAALWYISQLSKEKYESANLLVVRKTYRTLKDSCFAELKWAINRLGLQSEWSAKESPLEITNISTGQKIFFRGLDDPLKVTSFAVEEGVLCWLWIEEAYEIMSESDFDVLDESIRGEMPNGLFKQVTLTFNPWNERHWLKKRFFDSQDSNILAMTTDYRCNEWLDDTDRKLFEQMKKNNPRRYAVAGLGNWGISEGLVYENWEEQSFVLMSRNEYENLKTKPESLVVITDDMSSAFGLDFGYTNDPTAFFAGMIDVRKKTLYVFDEFYQKGMSNRMIAEKIKSCGYFKEHITADSAEPKSIDELKSLGIRTQGAKKGKDSISNGVQWIQDLHIVIHPRCVNFITEISNYSWSKDRFGNTMNIPSDDFNHLMDAMRYALEKFIIGNKWIY